MSDSPDTTAREDPTPGRQWGPRQRTSFALDVDGSGDGTDECDASVVFQGQPRR